MPIYKYRTSKKKVVKGYMGDAYEGVVYSGAKTVVASKIFAAGEQSTGEAIVFPIKLWSSLGRATR